MSRVASPWLLGARYPIMSADPDERRWDDGLTGAAYDVAAREVMRLKVTAGPGTGKSFALKRRVARRLQEGALPDRILALTFTRTAAGDMERELADLGIPGCERVKAGTLHSLCFQILSSTAVLEQTGRHPRPLMEFEERIMLQDLSGFGGIRQKQRRLEACNAAWARLQAEEPGWPSDETDRRFHEALLGWLRRRRRRHPSSSSPIVLLARESGMRLRRVPGAVRCYVRARQSPRCNKCWAAAVARPSIRFTNRPHALACRVMGKAMITTRADFVSIAVLNHHRAAYRSTRRLAMSPAAIADGCLRSKPQVREPFSAFWREAYKMSIVLVRSRLIPGGLPDPDRGGRFYLVASRTATPKS